MMKMINLIMLLALVFMSVTAAFSQNSCLDTIQSIKGERTFSLKAEKIDEDEFVLIFKNISGEALYFADLSKEEQSILGGSYEKIVLGENALELGGSKYFSLSQVGPGQEMRIKYTSKVTVLRKIAFDVEVSFIFNSRSIKKVNGQLFIDKSSFIRRMKTFVYKLDFLFVK
ncbi:hypothetical protein NAT51_15390 [Flavobacterium amniphilum]|uniref:hypothetical protein n=1 Tax=Flavobacterium amniphilum TaxID=1834035 RepID=UPI002029C87A|nr:hypothetical protein [Flavobacterium amniphilum]MCL9806919.1 hypothetical protein [Flavobacterium amniphilum]